MKMTNAIREALKLSSDNIILYDVNSVTGKFWLVNGYLGFRFDLNDYPDIFTDMFSTAKNLADFLRLSEKARKKWTFRAFDMNKLRAQTALQPVQPIGGIGMTNGKTSLRAFVAEKDENCIVAINAKFFAAVEKGLQKGELHAYGEDCKTIIKPLYFFTGDEYSEWEAIILPIKVEAGAFEHFKREWANPTQVDKPEKKKRVPMRAGMSAKFDSAARSALKSGNQYDKAIFYDTTTTPGSVWLSNGFLCLRFDAEMLPNPTPETIADFLQIPANRRKEWRIESLDMQPYFAKFPIEQHAYRIGGEAMSYGNTTLQGFIANDNRNITIVQGKYFCAIEPMIKKEEFQAYMAAHTEENPSPVIVTRYDAEARAHVMEALVMPVRADEIAVCHFARQWFQPTHIAHAAYDAWFAAHGAKSAKIA
jgi:hypothetical protein